MKQEDRQKLYDKLMEHAAMYAGGDAHTLKLFDESTTEDLDAIEPLIDEMLKGGTGDISLSFYEGSQLLVFLKFHEWHERRPGFVNCPECHIEFQASLPDARHHRDRCRVGSLIKILQAKLTTYEGSKSHAVSEHATST